jgi:hypothetical protein
LNLSFTRSKIIVLFKQPLFLFHLVAVMVLWIFVWIHAFNMDLTHDEAYSFKLIKTNYYRAMPGSANTHWLNSFFMKLFSLLFGDAPGYLRLHLVLAFPFFAQAIYRLALLIDQKSGQFVFYCLVLFNPYLLDFFSVARGYGLALLFQAWTLLLLIQAARTPFQYRKWVAVAAVAALAIGANLSYLYTVIGIGGVFLLYIVAGHPLTALYTNKQVRTICMLFGVLIIITIADLLFVKYYGKDLEFGGEDSFLQSLFGSVWEGSIYFADYVDMIPVLNGVTFILLMAACGYFSIKQIRQKKLTTGLVIAVPVMVILLLSVLFHILFKTPYLYGRTALQWYVPGILIICYALSDWLPVQRIARLSATVFALVICAGVIIHRSSVANSRVCFEWYFQANSRQPLYDLYDQHPEHPAISPVLHGLYVNYYSLIDKRFRSPAAVTLPENESTHCSDSLSAVLGRSDYIVTWFPVTPGCLHHHRIPYSIITTYPLTRLQLLKTGR